MNVVKTNANEYLKSVHEVTLAMFITSLLSSKFLETNKIFFFVLTTATLPIISDHVRFTTVYLLELINEGWNSQKF
jgi:hypothetical protein